MPTDPRGRNEVIEWVFAALNSPPPQAGGELVRPQFGVRPPFAASNPQGQAIGVASSD